MLQYKIPQNVQVEDKIFGNILTLKELAILGAGGGVSYVIYTFLARSYVLSTLELGLICIPFFISIAFAFIKINDISLLKYAFLLFEFLMKAQKRVWNKEGDILLTFSALRDEKKMEEEIEEITKDKAISEIAEISKSLNIGDLQEKQGREKIYGE